MSSIHGLFERPLPLEPILDSLPQGLIFLDKERRVLYFNRTAEVLCGYSVSEARGIPCRYIFRTNFCTHGCPALKALELEESVTVEGDLINRDRKRVYIRVMTAVLLDEQGELRGFLETIEDIRLLRDLDQRRPSAFRFGELIGRSPQMEEIYRILPMVAQTDSSVLITGETGTGKDLVAEMIHRSSTRAKGPFIKVNCGALPEPLLESELFGHSKGAFTGAVGSKPGRIRMAHTGTLYLTEIGDLPLPLQVKLLTFLDDRVVYPLGSARSFRADVRIIAATNRDLAQMVKEGRFREDLFFRLNVVRLNLPPLRKREGDIELLLDHFLREFAGRFGKAIKRFAREAREVLLSYPYPGNVRELRNIVEYATNICSGSQIELEHLPAYVLQREPLQEMLEVDGDEPGPDLGLVSLSRPQSLDWETVERHLILDALVRAKGRKGKAAELLGWGRSTLWRKMKQYGIV